MEEVETGHAGFTVMKFVVFCSDVATGLVGINSRVGTGAARARVGIDREIGCWRDPVREILLMIRWPANWQPHARRIISHCFYSGTKATHRRLVSLFTVLIPNPSGRPPPLLSYPYRPSHNPFQHHQCTLSSLVVFTVIMNTTRIGLHILIFDNVYTVSIFYIPNSATIGAYRIIYIYKKLSLFFNTLNNWTDSENE